jgi:hypothetical protein
MEYKVCSKCGEEKSIDSFIKNKQCKNGITGTCKECHAKETKQYALNNPEKIKQYQQKYRLNNKEGIRIRRKEIRTSCPERFKKYSEKTKNKEGYKSYNPEYYQKNKSAIKKSQQKYKSSNPEKCKDSAKRTRNKRLEENKAYKVLYRKSNKEYINKQKSIWRKNNPEKVREEKRMITKMLKDSYIKRLLIQNGFPKNEITKELIELERIIIKTKRLCKTLQD